MSEPPPPADAADVTGPDDVVRATRQLVATVDVASAEIGDDLPVVSRQVRGPTSCLDDPSRFQGSLQYTVVLPDGADPDEVLRRIGERWRDAGLGSVAFSGEDDNRRVEARDGERGASFTAEVVLPLGTLHYLASTGCRPLPSDAREGELRRGWAARVDPDREQVVEDVDRPLAEVVAELRAAR